MYSKYQDEHLYNNISIEEIRIKIYAEENEICIDLINNLLLTYDEEQVMELIVIPGFFDRIESYINPSYSKEALGFIRDLVYFDFEPEEFNISDLDSGEINIIRNKLKVKNLRDIWLNNTEGMNETIINNNHNETDVDTLDFKDENFLFDFLDGGNLTQDLDIILNNTEDKEVTDLEYYFQEPSSDYLSVIHNTLLSYAILIDAKDEKTIFDRISERDYYDRFFHGNMRLAVSIALGYSFHFQYLRDDLIQSGFLGILNAMERFDSSLGFKFSTFATSHIKQQIGRFIQDNQSTIRIPVHKREELFPIIRSIRDYKVENYCTPSLEYLTQKLEISIEELKEGINLIQQSTNYSDLSNEELKILFDNQIIDYQKDRLSESLMIELDKVLKKELTETEYIVLTNRFGINEIRIEKTLEEVGKEIGVTRERIRQIQSKALRKLKNKREIIILFDACNNY